MNWHRWLATLFVMLALVACTQGGLAQQAGAVVWGCVDPQPRHSPGSPNGETKRRCKVSGGRSGRAQGPLPAEWPGDPTHALRKAAPELQSAVAQFAPLFLGGGGAFLFAHGSRIPAARADVPHQQREVYLS
jgi:hypothetical protein